MVYAWIALFLAGFFVLSFRRDSLIIQTIVYAVLLLALTFLSDAHPVMLTVLWLLYVVVFSILNILPLRRLLISRHALKFFRRVMPSLSQTESEALLAGSVGWNHDIFSGKPDWDHFNGLAWLELSKVEREFLQGPVETLCSMIDAWQIKRDMKIPDTIWKFLKSNGFFGLIIPKQYGGKAFSHAAHSTIIAKVSGVSAAVGTVIGVPNSLGPAELLLQYGTDAQKNHYLPRLAKGDEIPCFALTSPVAGSDAGSITDYGIVCRAEFEGKLQTCLRLTWNKRYITLAPIATLLGLAFKLYDPEHILSDKEERGITLALIPTNMPGVEIGRRHQPLECAFPNGPTQGKDVLIPIDWIIGGEENIGSGWRMLMECLAAGRSITLPSLSTGFMKRLSLSTGVYARIRRQFNTYIGRFGGVESVLTQIAGCSFIADVTRQFTVAALDEGEVPVVASAISKYHCTEYGRKVINHAMDVHGGKGICVGSNNYLAQAYYDTPISITVEGANILTRSMIIFGQGAIRCHPYVLDELNAATESDSKKALHDFDQAMFAHVGFMLSNLSRSLWLGLSHGRLARTPSDPDPVLKPYYQLVSRYSAVLALVADVSMISFGGALKRKERLSARLGDLLSLLYMASAVLKYHRTNIQGVEHPIIEWSLNELLYRFQIQLDSYLVNVPIRPLAWVLRVLTQPLGLRIKRPPDGLSHQVAQLLLMPSKLREFFAEHAYLSPNSDNVVGQMHELLAEAIDMEAIEAKIVSASRDGRIDGKNLGELVKAAQSANIITEGEAEQFAAFDELRMRFINVDDFE